MSEAEVSDKMVEQKRDRTQKQLLVRSLFVERRGLRRNMTWASEEYDVIFGEI